MDNILKFEENGLGLLRDNKVRLVKHNQNWSGVEIESQRILNALNIDSLKTPLWKHGVQGLLLNQF